jgi:catechol 2,3-dioxygenase-like lactoylglutathione lyase family enzyme
VKSGKAKPATKPSVHVSIDVPELEAGLRFYAEVFGFEETARPFPAMAILDANNVSVCMHAKAAGSKSSSGGAEQRRFPGLLAKDKGRSEGVARRSRDLSIAGRRLEGRLLADAARCSQARRGSTSARPS